MGSLRVAFDTETVNWIALVAIAVSFVAGYVVAKFTLAVMFRSVVDKLTSPAMQMSLVVRKDLKMGTGKIAAQCSHAAVAVVQRALSSPEDAVERSWLSQWTNTGAPKVVLAVDSEESLDALVFSTKRARLPHYLVRDAGKTQIAAGSKTVLAIGPAPKEQIDALTGTLKLL